MAGIIRRWLDARAEAAAKRAELQNLFESFLQETEPLVPQASKHPKAALYRHAWKRACVLEILYQHNSSASPDYQKLASRYGEFRAIASEKYYRVAPEGPYGKRRLEMGEKAATRLLEFEAQRLAPTEVRQTRFRPLACIYIGRCEQGRVYVGQTVGPPESRWVQHRTGSTGPFKDGERYVEWKVVEGPIDPAKLDERESYYIGLHNADVEGYNDTKGNDWQAYERGRAERKRLIPLPILVRVGTN